MADAATRIQDRANKDRAFWNANYRPIAIQTAAEIAALPHYVLRYATEAPLASNLVRGQYGVARAAEQRDTKCLPEVCNAQQIANMDEVQAEGYAVQSILRAEESRQDARNASRLVKQLEAIKTGRGMEASGISLMAAAGKELDVVAQQQAGAYAAVGQTMGALVREAAAPYLITQRRVQATQHVPVNYNTPVTDRGVVVNAILPSNVQGTPLDAIAPEDIQGS
jgi:hypothetical protein